MLKWSNKLFGFDFPISCHLRLIQGCSIRRLDWKFDNLASFTNSVFWLLSTRICHVAAGLAFVSLNHSRILCHDSCIVLGWTGIFQIDSFTNCVSWLLHRPVAAGLEILLKSGWVTLDPECLPLIGGKLPLIMSVCTWWGDNCPQSTKVCMKQVQRIFIKDKKAQCGEKCSCLEICRVAAGLEIFDEIHSLTDSASRFQRRHDHIRQFLQVSNLWCRKHESHRCWTVLDSTGLFYRPLWYWKLARFPRSIFISLNIGIDGTLRQNYVWSLVV